jgi:NAD(P)-dependent dehydrogenase (short-subunit alcohol dehydrogenase family)
MSHPLALVIGAGPGIGLATGRRFAREGFNVGLVAREGGCLEAFEGALAEAGAPSARTLAADVRDAEALQQALERLQDGNLGEPRVLVYNASFGHATPPSRLGPEELEEAFRANVLAALQSARGVLPALRAAGRGTILFTGGGLALSPKAREASLSIGKAALRSLALCLAEELEPEGIHVATLTVQGFVQAGTPFGPDLVAEQFWELHSEPQGAWRREAILRP